MQDRNGRGWCQNKRYGDTNLFVHKQIYKRCSLQRRWPVNLFQSDQTQCPGLKKRSNRGHRRWCQFLWGESSIELYCGECCLNKCWLNKRWLNADLTNADLNADLTNADWQSALLSVCIQCRNLWVFLSVPVARRRCVIWSMESAHNALLHGFCIIYRTFLQNPSYACKFSWPSLCISLLVSGSRSISTVHY